MSRWALRRLRIEPHDPVYSGVASPQALYPHPLNIQNNLMNCNRDFIFTKNAKSASLRSFVAAESKAAEIIKGCSSVFWKCMSTVNWNMFRMCMSIVVWNSSPSFLAPPSRQIKLAFTVSCSGIIINHQFVYILTLLDSPAQRYTM